MSELRAITKALRSLHNRLTGVTDCLAVLTRNSEQEADWRHEQRNEAQRREGEKSETLRSLKQVEEFQGALWKYLAELDVRLSQLADTRHDDVKEIKTRLRRLESDQPPEPEEVTQT